MIRLAFLAVLLIGGLIALGAFYLVRGSEAELTEIAAPSSEDPTPTPAPTPVVDKLYFLRGIDLDDGDVVLVLYNVGPDALIVRNRDALKAAQDVAYVNTTTTDGQQAGSLLLAIMGAPPEETIAQIYRDDMLIGTVSCTSTACGSFADSPDIDYAGLIDAGAPIQRVSDQFDTYDDYTDTIDAIRADPNYMLLDARPTENFPTQRRTASMEVHFPTVIASIAAPFDATAHEILVSTALTSVLPDGATLRDIAITDLGHGVVGDSDSRTPVLAGGAPIIYPDVRYYGVSAKVDGAAMLNEATLDNLTTQTIDQYDFDAQFADFTRDRLQSSCADCFWVLVDGPFRKDAGVVMSTPEIYTLDYYDLRDTP